MPHDTMLRLAPIERTWLVENLAKTTWWDPDCAPGLCWRGLELEPWQTMRDPLTREHMDFLNRLIKRRNLPCRMLRGHIGYTFAVAIYDHAGGIGPPEPVYAFSDRHLPSSRGGWPNKGYAWGVLSSFTHSDANKCILASYGLAMPLEREHYQYGPP